MMNDTYCDSLAEIKGNSIKTILVPTDFSEHSNLALQAAIDIAEQQHAVIYLLHVLSSRQNGGSLESVQRQLARFPGANAVEIVPEIRRGKPYKEILKVQAEKHADLIIIAPHKRAESLFALFRSVTEKVKAKAWCTVLVVGA